MRISHTMLRVSDMAESIAFYTDVLGMNLLRQKDYPNAKFTVAFVGYTAFSDGPVIELTHNWGVDAYNIGDGFGHVALEVDDIYGAVESIRNQGGEVVREAGPMKDGTKVLAFVKDPTGYIIELIKAD